MRHGSSITAPLEPTIFLISPAKLSGKRGAMLENPKSDFALALALHSARGAPLGEVFAFVSGLYFRGKMAYARAFGRSENAEPGAFVMTAGGGLCTLDESLTVDRIRRWNAVDIHHENPHFTAPLARHAHQLLEAHSPETRFVLLGSIASNKYVAPLLEVFGPRLLFPTDFLGLGDMSRGSLLLRAVREGRELEYRPVMDR